MDVFRIANGADRDGPGVYIRSPNVVMRSRAQDGGKTWMRIFDDLGDPIDRWTDGLSAEAVAALLARTEPEAPAEAPWQSWKGAPPSADDEPRSPY